MKVKAFFLMCILLIPIYTHAVGTIIYVDGDANGLNNGSSWENAYTYIQDAIAGSKSVIKPVEIHIAQGTYRPDMGDGFTQGDREATFDLVNSISLVGGYAGFGETDPNARDIELYETILSGDLNNNDTVNPNISNLYYEQSRAENSYRVVTSRSVLNSTYIDGLTIKSGNANDTSYQTGSGIYNYYSKLIIKNCTFKNNSAYNGGGVCNYSYNPTFINCKFIENMAVNFGGGIYNYRSDPTLNNCTIEDNSASKSGGGMYNSYSSPAFTTCTFSGNSSNDGGAIYNDNSDFTINECSFNSNHTTHHGGGIYNYASSLSFSKCTFQENSAGNSGAGIYSEKNSNPTINLCTFKANHASKGGGIYSSNSSTPSITNCDFSNNIADNYGGGICNYNSKPSILVCKFTENFASNYGGGIYNYGGSNLTISNCDFYMNSSNLRGGGIYNTNSSPKLTDCSFILNEADNSGGGMYNNSSSNPEINNCIFSDNKSGVDGGGLYNSESNPIIIGCAFYSNISENNAGGLYNNYNSIPNLTNCLFIENLAKNNGGGMYNLKSNPIIKDCEFNSNTSENQGGGICNDQSNPDMSDCLFKGNYAANSGGGICNLTSIISAIETSLFTENSTGHNGGAIYNDKCTIKLSNCIFAGNSALYRGAGVDNANNSDIKIVNCVFEGNLSPEGNAASCFSSNIDPENIVTPSSVQVTNCILWDYGDELFNEGDSTITISYCDVKNGLSNPYDPNENIIWGDGILETDPCFVNPGYWNLNQTPNDVNDDYYVVGDYHLKSQIGRFSIRLKWETDDVTSPCIDAGDPISPLYYEPYPNGNRTNIGAYAGTTFASKSLYHINSFSKAKNPEPGNNIIGTILDPMLCWASDSNVIAHELYFGTDEFPGFLKRQEESVFDPGALQPYTQYYWRIDDLDNSLNRVSGDIWTFKTGPIPDYAYNPTPLSGEENVDFDIVLTWNPCAAMANARYYYYYYVYLGTDYNDVFNATLGEPLDVLVYSASTPSDSNHYDPDYLEFNQTYYWRIDERISSRGNDIITKGNVWSFTTGSMPNHIYNPSPPNNKLDVHIEEDIILSWSPGTSNPATYDVYFSYNFNDINNASIANPQNCLVSIAQDANYYDPGQLEFYQTYYWRIDEADSNGFSIKGDIWTFTTDYHTKGRSCFTADTPVWVDGKMVEISKVIAGQTIGNSDSAMSISGSVTGLEEHREGMNPCYEMTLESGNIITIVHSHYFKTVSSEWKKIEELSAGMQLQTMNGPITIKSVVKKEKPFLGKSYNLMLDGSEQYFVGIDGVIALDCSKKTWEILEAARK